MAPMQVRRSRLPSLPSLTLKLAVLHNAQNNKVFPERGASLFDSTDSLVEVEYFYPFRLQKRKRQMFWFLPQYRRLLLLAFDSTSKFLIQTLTMEQSIGAVINMSENTLKENVKHDSNSHLKQKSFSYTYCCHNFYNNLQYSLIWLQ